MEKIHIPEKEKYTTTGYSTKYSRDLIDEICNNPDKYKSIINIGIINDAVTIYKYNNYISRAWLESVIDVLSRYIKE